MSRYNMTPVYYLQSTITNNTLVTRLSWDDPLVSKMIRYFISVSTLVAVAYCVKPYRPDYEYNPTTDAFYKLHTDEDWISDAKTTCEAENAKLMTAFPEDVVQAHGMMKKFPDIGEYIWANDDDRQHDVAEMDVIELEALVSDYHYNLNEERCEVISRGGEVNKIGCYPRRPFICKVEAKDVFYDSQCHVFAIGYQYVESVGSCYKISRTRVSWNQAYAECQSEGAHLLVLNSELEHQAVQNLTRLLPPIGLRWYYAGIRANKTKDGSPLVFKTIFGQTLEEAGYAVWYPGEPNNWHGDELCGTITEDAKYNDVACYHSLTFICEKETTTT